MAFNFIDGYPIGADMRKLSLILSLVLMPSMCLASPPSSSYTYTTGEEIKANEVQTNENNIYSYLLGGVDTYADGSIVNADISAGAGIIGSKLDLSTPGAIGATSASTGAFTTLSASGATTIGDAAADTLHINANTLTFEGVTANDFETTLTITDPTADRTTTLPNANSVTLPSGAVFFMLTGSCPAGTTDVTSTYSDKFLRINATQGSTGGSDTVTITEANLPSHTHAVGTLAAANESAHTHPPKFQSSAVAGGNSWIGIGTITSSNDGAGTTITTQGSIGAGTAHTHTLSGSTGAIGSGTAATITNPYVTCKMCQVD